MSHQDQIFFLPIKYPGAFAGGSFTPVEDFDALEEARKAESNPDGFLYPPIMTTVLRKTPQPGGAA